MDKTRYQFLSSLLDKEIEIARNRSLSFTDSRNAFLASVHKSNSPLSSNSRTDQLSSSTLSHHQSVPTNHISKSNSTNQAFTIHDLESQNQRTTSASNRKNNNNYPLLSQANGSFINSSSPRINYKHTQTYPSPDTAQKALAISSESSFHKEFESIQNKISALERKMKEGESQQNINATTITTNNSIASPHFTHPSLQSALNQKNNSANKYQASQQSPRFNSHEQNNSNANGKQKNNNSYDLSSRQDIGLDYSNAKGKKQTPRKDRRESTTKKSPGSGGKEEESGLKSLAFTSKFDGIEKQSNNDDDQEDQYISQKSKQTVKRQLEEEYQSRRGKETDEIDEQQQISFENTPQIARNEINNNNNFYQLFNSKTQQRTKRTVSQNQEQQQQHGLQSSSNNQLVSTKGSRRRPQVDIYDRSSSRKRRSTSRRNRSSQHGNKHIRFVAPKSSERKQHSQIIIAPSSGSLLSFKNTQTPPKNNQQTESSNNSNQIGNATASDLYSEETKALQKEYMFWQLKKEKQHLQYQSILEANQRNTEKLAALKKQANKLIKQKRSHEEHAEEYDKLFENFERSEAVRQKQKLLIGSLKDELKTLQKSNSQNNNNNNNNKRNRGS